MELTPKLLTEDVDFRVAYRGYDRDEVDDFLERVAVAVGQLQQQLAEAVSRARSAEGRLKAGGAGAPAPAAAPAAAERAPSPARAAEAEDLNEELRRTLVLAQRTADAAVREAREQAAQIQSDAEERSQRTLADAEAGARRKADEARTRLLAEIAELEGIRESMRGDVSVLERHLEEQRLQLRSSFQELQRLLDDPTSFRIAPTPPLSGVAAPAVDPPRVAQLAAPAPAAPPAESPAAPEPASRTPEPDDQPSPAPESGPPAREPHAAPPPAEQSPQPRVEQQPSPKPEAQSGPPSGSVSFREGATPASGGGGGDSGPRTQPVAAARFEEDDNDAFLAELRKAMAEEADTTEPERGATLFDQDDRSRRRPRFGRRP
jgi:DivIVA domain-containing protein